MGNANAAAHASPDTSLRQQMEQLAARLDAQRPTARLNTALPVQHATRSVTNGGSRGLSSWRGAISGSAISGLISDRTDRDPQKSPLNHGIDAKLAEQLTSKLAHLEERIAALATPEQVRMAVIQALEQVDVTRGKDTTPSEPSAALVA